MKKLIFFLTVLISLASVAQTGAKVSGVVLDGQKAPMAAATVCLMTAKDSTLNKVVASLNMGGFVFENVAPGSYFILVSAVGHQKVSSDIFIVTEQTPETALQAIVLPALEQGLETIVVTAKKPWIEQKIDRTIINVDASPTNAGNNALEVLEKSPGISVDKDGNISLKGKQGVSVLIDGRPAQLSGEDLANLLRNLNASQLAQIEIMTNPPARYDAAGNAGVINIKTKKEKKVGYNGSVTAGYSQGIYPRANQGGNFNYRKGKINLFTNISHSYRKNYSELDIQRKFKDPDSKELLSDFNQEARMKSTGHAYNGKLGMDYFAGRHTTLGFVVSGFSAPSTFTNNNLNKIMDAGGALNRTITAFAWQKEHWSNKNANVNFRHVLDSGGKELTADADYSVYRSENRLNLSNAYFDATGNTFQKTDTLYSNLPQKITIYSGRVDYVHPLKNNARFEAGLKSSFVKTDNDAILDTVHNGELIRDRSRSNHFIYEEKIYAAYVNLSGTITKGLTGQFGLRLENTNAKGRQLTSNQDFERQYTQLFPTAFLQYQFNEKNTLGLNYGRRIRRPDYQDLNPFFEYIDRYTYKQGNPDLKPEFSNNLELAHTYNQFLTTTINYTLTSDILQQVIEQNESTNETYVKNANVARQRQYGVSVSANFKITPWWSANLYANAFNILFEGVVNNQAVSVGGNTLQFNGSQQFKISKTLSAELNGWYRTAGVDGVIRTRPVGVLSVGFSQQLWNGNGVLRLGVNDVLKSQEFNVTSRYGNVDAQIQQRRDSRTVNLSFTWRFAKGKIAPSKKSSRSSAADEQQRVGVGG